MVKLRDGYAATMRVPAGKRDVLVFDDKVGGFGIRKFASGEASFILKYPVSGKVVNGVAIPGRTRRISLGPVTGKRGEVEEKRALAEEVKERARMFGEDLIAEREEANAKAAIPKLGDLVEPYLAARAHDDGESGLDRLRANSMREAVRYLQTTWKPLHKLRLDEITTKHVKDTLREIARTSGKPTADRARGALATFYVWAIAYDHAEANPTIGIADKSKSQRTRKLSEDELVQIWRACDDGPYGRIVRLLILTGQRREEVGGLLWAEIDPVQRWIELPEERCKNHRRHLIPLAPVAMAILEGAPRNDGDYVFGRHGATPYNGWAHGKLALDSRIAEARKKAGEWPMPPWVLHDLRRALATRLSELSMAEPHIVEAILNHVSGHKAGVAGVYNHAAYITQKRDALEKWGAHVAALVEEKGPKIRAKPRAKELA
jgi:integrase